MLSGSLARSIARGAGAPLDHARMRFAAEHFNLTSRGFAHNASSQAPLGYFQGSQVQQSLGGDVTNIQQEEPRSLSFAGLSLPVAALQEFSGGANALAGFGALSPLTLPVGNTSFNLPMGPVSPNTWTPIAGASPPGQMASPNFFMPSSLASPGPLGSPVAKTAMPPKKGKSINRL